MRRKQSQTSQPSSNSQERMQSSETTKTLSRSTSQPCKSSKIVMHDTGIKQKWKQVLESIQREVNMTSETLNLKKQFSGGFGGPAGTLKKQTITERMPVNVLSADNNAVFQPIVPIPQQQKRQPAFERFGNQAPFQHTQAGPDSYFGNDIQGDDPLGTANYCYVQKRNKSQFPMASQQPLPRQNNFGNPFDSGQDPDIWDPPTPPLQKPLGAGPQQSRASIPNQGAWGAPPRRPPPYQQQNPGQMAPVQPQPAAMRRPPKITGAVAGVKRETSQNPSGAKTQQQRGYDKPWLSGVDKGGNGGAQEQKKNTFLYSLYSDGVGPDSELINMLERDVVDRNPQVNFADIAELDDAKKTLQEAVLLPLYMPNYFKGIRRPWKGVLLFGPPGTGKTMLAKAVATQGKTTFFNITSSSISSKWKGESEKLVRILFEMARFYAPTTIFMDEIDAIAGARSSGEHESNRRVKAELLIQMDGVSVASSASANENQGEGERQKNVIVLAATNIPWDLDEAFRRRLEKRIYIPLPSEKGRQQLFDINLKGIKADEGVDWTELVRKTKGYSGADIANVCREAAMMPMRRKLLEGEVNFDEISKMNHDDLDVPITMADFNEALKNIQKSVSQNSLEDYQKWMAEFGCV